MWLWSPQTWQESRGPQTGFESGSETFDEGRRGQQEVPKSGLYLPILTKDET